jgi:hypothetical protein
MRHNVSNRNCLILRKLPDAELINNHSKDSGADVTSQREREGKGGRRQIERRTGTFVRGHLIGT